jgi:D-glutamate N-acetyltransferase
MNVIELTPPYLIFLGDVTELTYAKTGAGLVQWRPEQCLAQLSLVDRGVDLGLPAMSVAEAAAAGARSLVIGTAAVGGSVPDAWVPTLLEAIAAGLDIVAGVHESLRSHRVLSAAAREAGVRLVDVRVPPPGIPVATGARRPGLRLLTVGTDCAVGKKYTALALEQAMRAAGLQADFRASGQTGIMIAGQGMPIDAVVADFLAGAAELLSPANAPDHWDVIEGQGSLVHPGYAAVSMGLLLGSQPDVFVVCHEAGRTHISGWEDFELPDVAEIIERTVAAGSITNPAIRCVGISVNTSRLPREEVGLYLHALQQETGLPCFDPLRAIPRRLIDELAAMAAATVAEVQS